jgi:RNA polymerase sigma factor (sigma-70 family)
LAGFRKSIIPLTPNFTNIHAGIIERCKAEDRNAQQQLYQLYAKPMLNASFRILGSKEEAEDLLQDAFITMFSSLNSYREESSFGAWFKRIVVNKSLNKLKVNKRLSLNFNDLSAEDIANDLQEEEMEQAANSDFSMTQIKTAVNQLPQGYRIIFNLYMFEDYSHQEIAHELGISESTSKSQLNRAKKKLRELLMDANLTT